jgi:NADPH-dependent 2,4-dienoyl-CoA reductase/sulfur reductase-like enzyme/peroxiredoxin family protein/rhodanese-related sulfurtransferase/TusA-related sulfurtransferase
MSKKVVIVGGVAGGASAAARLRRLDESIQIIMFERGEYISFANCGLPYHIGEVIADRNMLLVQTPEAMKARFNIDVRVQSDVIHINKEAKCVTVRSLMSGDVYEESYDELILSTGSTPLKPPIPGIDATNIFSLWNIPDTDVIKAYVDQKKPARAVVIGGGFIGVEMAENLIERGIQVSLVEKLDQVMTPMDKDMAALIHEELGNNGIALYLGNGVTRFVPKGEMTEIHLENGMVLDADLIILSIGIRPQSELAKEAGLTLNARGGIVVDSRMRTSEDFIYAIGDVVEVEDFVTKTKTMVPLAGPANKQGRIVANILCGMDEEYLGTQGTSIVKVFDQTVAGTGLNEKTLNRMGKVYKQDYHVAIIHQKSHAGYYPGAMPMVLKLIFDLQGVILGAQIVGYDGVDKRIDVLATALRLGAKVKDLKSLELAYAPPYSSAKDPVNMVGFVADNILTGKMDYVGAMELDTIDLNRVVLLDVREPIERELGYIHGSINMPIDQIRDRIGELDKDKPIITYCAIGLRGYVALRILKELGFKDVKNLNGGYSTYSVQKCDSDKGCSIPMTESKLEFHDSGDVIDKHFEQTGQTFKLNACGLQCPGPIMQVYKRLEEMERGDMLDVTATDPGFKSDIGVWCKKTGNSLIESGKRDKVFYAIIKKGMPLSSGTAPAKLPDDKTMVVFSGELDKAIAAFIIANGAAAMGRNVTMFFTFWGLNVLRKPEKISVKKDFLGAMFSGMMPRGSKKLGLSKMNMMGMGAPMIRMVMKKHGVDSLEQLIQQAMDNGVQIVACNMSMDLMGITAEELMDGVQYGGVATFLGSTDDANMSLFI